MGPCLRAQVPVAPGDQIQASVSEQADGTWITRVDDLNTGISGQMIMSNGSASWGSVLDSNPGSWYQYERQDSGISYSGGYTAEWILEDYNDSQTNSYVPFAAYGTITFGNLSVDNSSPDLTHAVPDGIVRNGVPLSVPTPLTTTGFSIVYTG